MLKEMLAAGSAARACASGIRAIVDHDAELYRDGAFADTGARMRVYEERACDLAFRSVVDMEGGLEGITHLIAVSGTGFAAPGLDLDLIDRLALSRRVERTCIGFMGCYASINALRFDHSVG